MPLRSGFRIAPDLRMKFSKSGERLSVYKPDIVYNRFRGTSHQWLLRKGWPSGEPRS
jgi:hypothetical protein